MLKMDKFEKKYIVITSITVVLLIFTFSFFDTYKDFILGVFVYLISFISTVTLIIFALFDTFEP